MFCCNCQVLREAGRRKQEEEHEQEGSPGLDGLLGGLVTPISLSTLPQGAAWETQPFPRGDSSKVVPGAPGLAACFSEAAPGSPTS